MAKGETEGEGEFDLTTVMLGDVFRFTGDSLTFGVFNGFGDERALVDKSIDELFTLSLTSLTAGMNLLPSPSLI
jgi:hypothetical protein